MNIKSLFPLALLLSSMVGCGPLIYRTHPVEMLNQIERNPGAHLGELYAFKGRVIQARQSWGRLVFQMIVSDYSTPYGGPSLVVRFTNTKLPIARDHDVSVLGRITGKASGKNAFGGTVTAVSMDAVAVFDRTAERVGWLGKEEELFQRWRSGELFAPSSDIK